MRILHLTDLHVGMSGLQWLWPTAKKAVFDDLSRMQDKNGNIDLVIFSGDLTQKSTPEEYSKLNEILNDLWNNFHTKGSKPKFFPIPGNHDLIRPKALDSTTMTMKDWWLKPEIRSAFWSRDPAEYRDLIEDAFLNYTNWFKSLKTERFPLIDHINGDLPGDISAELNVNGISLGIVGLNTAWLQLSEGNYKEKLDVDIRQLMALTNNDPEKWCTSHDFNLLVTHHPQQWLHPKSLEMWRSEINTPSWFDAHLFGHMHEASSIYTSEGGSNGRRFIQGSSLFGLEKTADGLERIHGYSILELSKDEQERKIYQWPRRAHKGQSATWKLIADPDFDYDDSEKINYSCDVSRSDPKTIVPPPQSDTTINPASGKSSLRALRKSIPQSSAYRGVRGGEKELGITALDNNRKLWLVSDWGLGDDQFIRSIQSSLSVEQSYLLALDCQNFFCREDIYNGVQEQFGCSFEEMCESISLEGKCIFVLEDVRMDKNPLELQADIEFIVTILLEYCRDLRLIIKSRRPPDNSQTPVIELRPFDEADTMSYVAAHDLGGSNLAEYSFISQIFRHTDGIPNRIDRALQNVQIVGADQLHTLDTDVAGKSAAILDAPAGLVETLSELEHSKDPTTARAFKLLKVLTMFPRGEQLATVKRFHSKFQFYPQDAIVLLNAGLVDAVEIPNIAVESTASAKALVVRRTVREYLYASLSASELNSLNKKSLELYFGSNWSLKGIKSPAHMRFNDPQCGSWQIGNASTLVLRATRAAVEKGISSNYIAARDLATSYCANLVSGNHFLAVISLSEDIIPLFESLENEIDITLLQSNFSKSLRITGNPDGAIQICKKIQSSKPSKKLLQYTHLTLALSYQALDREKEALDSAQDCINIDPRSNTSLQARSITIGLHNEDVNRTRNLWKLEEQARKKGAYVVANNISITLANEIEDLTEAKKLLAKIVNQTASDGDHHNAVRSVILLAKVYIVANESIPSAIVQNLIAAYHYLYGDGLQDLFIQCHAVLWHNSESNKETDNLLRLFRYSSLKWRIRGNNKLELNYLKRLSSFTDNNQIMNTERSSREWAYFLARMAQAISNQKLLN